MDDLIKRLEEAAEGSRELDAAIWQAVDPTAFALTKSSSRAFGNRDWTKEEADRHAQRRAERFSPHYTTSLDAALALVPEGWFCPAMGERRTKIWSVGDKHEPVDWHAELQWIDGGGRLIRGKASALPVALCIAALKARNA